MLIGVERKTIGWGLSDLLSSIRSNRLAGGQVGRAIDTYDAYYLVVEGPWRRGEDGWLEVGFPWRRPKGGFRYAEVSKFLNGLVMQGNVHLWRTFDLDETAATLVDWHDQWNKPWDEHKTGKAIYAPAPSGAPNGRRGSFFAPKATPVHRWLYQIDGIGQEKTHELAKHFPTPASIATASEAEWQTFDGVGPKGAARIFKWIHG